MFMRFLIFSDSHGHPECINEALARAGHFDGVIFLGDGLRDLPYCDIPPEKLYSVKGNCDLFYFGEEGSPEQRLLILENKRIFITHGHRYGVKSSLDSLIYAATERDADIVLFGHTHEMLERRLTPDKYPSLSKPLYVFNPGAISGYKSSFGCLDITLRGEIMLSHGEL